MATTPIAPSPGSNVPSPVTGPTPGHGGSTGNVALKPLAQQPITKIVTSKEWVLPPRPKPGRKPSADTPATKRKAQNRAAQRAFRERRATRVAELEAKLSEVEKDKEVKEMNYKNTLGKLQMENKYLMKALSDMKADFASLKQTVQAQAASTPNNISSSSAPSPAVYSNGTVSAPSPLNYFKPSQGVNQEYRFPQQQQQQQQQQQRQRSQGNGIISQPGQAIQPASNPSPTESTRSPMESQPSTKTSLSSDLGDCGACEKDDCICAKVGLRTEPPRLSMDQHQQQLKQFESFKPMAAVSLKRKQEDFVEVDYTAKFAKGKPKPMPKFKRIKQERQQANSNDEESREFSKVLENITDRDFESPMEQCGFCSDDSPCVCREAAKEAANAITELQNSSRKASMQMMKAESTLPPISRHSSVSSINKLPVLHPGPSVEITRPPSEQQPQRQQQSEPGEKKLGCTGNPGTCTQCQLDPMSTLFCTTIASKAEGEETGSNSTTKSSISEENRSPVSPPVSTHSSKVSSPLVTVQDEELNSMVQKVGAMSSANDGVISNLNANSTDSSQAGKGIYIPCADAYKTLSRHKGFHSVDFSTLVGKLTTRGMQVEVQSVANVLRELDRRLYN
ncbi:bZIP transcription factor CYBJADRAFT_169000 [Cyberlindnera jadinii NRRL Y-1542]|uniref:BZIP domain-containing protein n=1 Tax=Cyberlindnera jadinii (strain ATCC 18201 / CBS 1600 / BCRC 20928 / JCM 3617 / NBRC 0987 / NRRL Y-1542) TaxID=983966 RepID=A0A1E4RXH5_CYBJN|nr:hypothetical protein CYBJADRAFT_169000 [Cyberlindnera jadinii NRRL Y-1542]ODV71979.1 hypothetical protein CYBJADRAFT_169000 [Cyberlindnera jadinii NRRL Y-1542]